MKKAIICLGLVTILLLTGFSVAGSRVSTLEKNFVSKQVVKQNAVSDLPDLTVTINAVDPFIYRDGLFKWRFEGYVAYVTFKNLGPGALLRNNSPVIEVRFIAEKDGVEYINFTEDRFWYLIPDTWEPGVVERYTCPYYGGTELVGATLKVWIDPNNLIEEISDDNNIAQTIGPNSYSYPTVLNNIQFSHSYQQINLQFNQLSQMTKKTTIS